MLDRVKVLLQDGLTLESVDVEVFGRAGTREVSGSEYSFTNVAPAYLTYAEGRKKASTFKVDRFRLGALCRSKWAQLPLAKITPSILETWCSARKSAGISGPAINRYLALISALYQWAILKELASENPARRVLRYSEKGRELEVFLTPEQSRALIAIAEPAFRPMITYAILTGMRRGEILDLRWRAVDFERGVITVESSTAKSGKTRKIPMREYLADILRSFWAERKIVRPDRSDRVFDSWMGQRFTAPTVRRMMEDAVERCTELPEDIREKLTFHSLRHTATSQMLMSGMSIFEVSKILGHSSTTMTERYAHFTPSTATGAKAGLDKMESALAPPGRLSLKPEAKGKRG